METEKIQTTWDDMLVDAPPTIKDYARRLKKIPQSYNWHPEGNVDVHSRIVYMRASWFGDIDILMAALLHDFGKVDTTKPNGRGGYSAHDHEKVSARLAKYASTWLSDKGANPAKVIWLIENHMRVKYLNEMKTKKKLELINHMWFDDLNILQICDSMRGEGTAVTLIEVLAVGGNPIRFLYNKIKTFFVG